MRNSKQKSSCAYAKVCKTKSPDHNTTYAEVQKNNQKNQYLYKELMDQLDIEDSQYIHRLCKQNQNKMERKVDQEQNRKMFASHDTDFDQSIKENFISTVQRNSKRQNLRSIVNNSERFRQYETSKTDSQNNHFKINKFNKMESSSSQLSQRQQSEAYFLSDIDNYLNTLKHKTSNPPLTCKNSKSNNERSFRKTVEIGNKDNRNYDNGVSLAKYQSLLNKFKDSLETKEELEDIIQSKDYKLDKIKAIVRSMHFEIIDLKEQLIFQRKQKKKYQTIVSQFATKIHHTRPSSQKYYIPHHQKRNSHVPSLSQTVNNDKYYQQYKRIKEDLTNITMDKFSKTNQSKLKEKPLKKTGKHHKHKMSEAYLEIPRQFRQNSSIYDGIFER